MAKSASPPKASAPPADDGKGGVVGPYRIKGIFMTPPGILGFSHMIKPDEYLGKSQFKVALHLTPAAVNLMAKRLQDQVINPFSEELRKLSPKKALKDRPAAVWLEDKLKAPHEASRIQLPSISFNLNAHYITKQGEQVDTSVKAWDGQTNALLDLRTLRLGMGSTIQVGFNASLWSGGLNKFYIEPSLRLVGVKVLKAEHYGAGTGGLSADVTDEDLALLEEGFEMEDLSQFAMGPSSPVNKQIAKEEEVPGGELDDEIPF